jgi:hypothetical protein
MKLTKNQETMAAKIILVAFIIGLIAIPAFALLTQTVTIPGSGTLRAVGVAFYKDAAATQPATNVTWGLLNSNGSYSTLLYCKDIKNTNVTLALTINGWNPTDAVSYMTAGWNYTGATIHPNAIVPILFQLQIFSNATGITSFSYNYVVVATGH